MLVFAFALVSLSSVKFLQIRLRYPDWKFLKLILWFLYGPGFKSISPESFKLLVILTNNCCKYISPVNATNKLTSTVIRKKDIAEYLSPLLQFLFNAWFEKLLFDWCFPPEKNPKPLTIYLIEKNKTRICRYLFATNDQLINKPIKKYTNISQTNFSYQTCCNKSPLR